MQSISGFRDRRRRPDLATPATIYVCKKLNQSVFYMDFDSKMKITVKIKRVNETKHVELKEKSTIQELLEKINIKPDTVIVLSGNKPIPIDDILVDGQELTILQVASGG